MLSNRPRRILVAASADYLPPVRSLSAFALVLAACSGGDRSSRPARRALLTRPAARGLRVLALRVSRNNVATRVSPDLTFDDVLTRRFVPSGARST